MTQEDKQQIKNLTTYPEYHVLEKVIKAHLDELKDVTTLDVNSHNYPTQAMAKSFAYEAVSKFLSTIGVLSENKTEKSNTYE